MHIFTPSPSSNYQRAAYGGGAMNSFGSGNHAYPVAGSRRSSPSVKYSGDLSLAVHHSGEHFSGGDSGCGGRDCGS
jgi:hypothetical protein